MSITGSRLVFDIRRADGTPVIAHLLSLSPLRRVVKDYYTVCDSYYAAIRTATPDRIEALDMARRSLHDEGSNVLMERLARKVKLDFDTAAPVHLDLRAALEGMTRPPPLQRPQAVLFACGSTPCAPRWRPPCSSRRSASLYVGSAGVRKAELDPFAAAAMDEIGIDIKAHRPITFEELEDLEGLNFDLIVTLSPERHKALELTRTLAAEVEYWPTADPTAIEGSREQRLNAYREVRDQLLARIRARFAARSRQRMTKRKRDWQLSGGRDSR